MKKPLLLWLCLIYMSGNAQSADQDLEAYKTRLMEEVIPACDAAGDSKCVFSKLNELTQTLANARSWGMYVEVMAAQIEYARQFDRYDIHYETLKAAESAIAREKAALGEVYEDRRIENQLLWGSYFYERGDWARAFQKFKDMEKALQAQSPPSQTTYEHLASTCKYLGGIHRRWAEYDIAQQYLLKSIDYEKAAGEDETNSGYIALPNKHLGDLFFQRGDFEKSEFYYLKAKQIYTQADTTKRRNRNGLTNTLLGLANLYKTNGKFSAAVGVLQEATRVEGNSKGLDFDLWFHLGELYAAQGDIAQAYTYFNRAFDRRVEAFGIKHYKVAEVYSAYGELAARQGDYPCALEQYQTALISLSDDFSDADFRQNPLRFQRTFIKKDLIGVFSRKVDALRQWAAATGDTAHLHTAWATVQAAVHALDILKNGDAQSEQDKLLFFRESARIFEHGMHLALALGAEYYPAAFELSEKSKAIVLLEAFRSASALRLAGIPDSLLERESQLKYEISSAEDALFKGDQSQELRDRLLSVQNEYRSLLRTLEQEYSDYYRLRYDNTVITTREAQRRLRRGQAMVVYFTGENARFAFVLQPGSMAMHLLPSDEALDPLVRDMRGGIYDYFLAEQRTAAAYQASAEKYVASARKLHYVLLAPLAAMLPQDLLIIPDGVLGYLPFEALLTADPAAATRFKTHPYLLRRHRVSYCYSATLWREMQQNAARSRQLAAFAPAFPNEFSNKALALRGALDTLYFNKTEIEEIVGVLRQDGAFTGAQAAKAEFVRRAPVAGILHIASHGIANDTASGYSFIAFTPISADPDSNRLYARELYNMRLNAALVVLSACETGVGELKKGEGVISLARAFAYAGAQSVISTLWSVNDESTTHIMRALYKDLRAGRSKSVALQNAKTAYLQSREDDLAAHPFYWSAYIAVGDMRPLYRGKAWPAGLGVLALVMTGVFWWRRKIFKTQTPAS